MKRTIKFRGKNLGDPTQWVYGSLVQSKSKAWIIPAWAGIGGLATGVMPETVGQYIGLKDKNGTEVYEGDLIFADSYKPSTMQIQFQEGGFCAIEAPDSDKYYMPIDINHFYPSGGCCFTVTGNIHEKQEA